MSAQAADEARGVAIIRHLLTLENQGEYSPPIYIGPYSYYMIICALQLAWRHPEVSPKLKQVWRDTGEDMIRALAPDVAALLERGWDPAQDVERDR